MRAFMRILIVLFLAASAAPVFARVSPAPKRARTKVSFQVPPVPPPLTREEAFFYFIAIYGPPDNVVERYGEYFDGANYKQAMANEFEKARFTEMIRAKISDGVRGVSFDKRFTLVGSTTFEGYTMLGEYSFENHSFPVINLPYNSFCVNLDRSSGVCHGTFLHVGRNARVWDAANADYFSWSLPMPEEEARAFLQGRTGHGTVDRKVTARITYSVMNRQGRLRDGRALFIPFIYSVEIFTDGSLTKKLGEILAINSQAPRSPEELAAAEERAESDEQRRLDAERHALETNDCVEGKQTVASGAQRVFVISPERECWTPWLVIGGPGLSWRLSGDIVVQVVLRDGNTLEAVDGPGKVFRGLGGFDPVQKLRFKSLGKEPVMVTLGVGRPREYE